MSEEILSFCDISGNSVKNYQGSRKYIATGDIVNNKICSYTEVEYKNKPSRANQEAELGDVLFAKMKETRKVICITEDNVDCIYSTGFYVIKPKKSVLTEYLYWLFNSSNFNRNKDKLCKGATQKALNNEGLKKIAIKKLPTIEEQKNIVSKLNKISNLINSKMKQLELLDEVIKSQFVEMFENENYPKKTLNELTNKITDGSHNPPTGIAENEGYMMLSSQNIINNSLNYENVRFLKKEDFEKENLRTNLNRGDVLLTIVGTVGRTAIITDETNITLQRSVAVLKPTKEINSIYLVGAINSDDVIRQLNKGAKGVAQKGIYLNDIKKILIAAPPIELQNQFADIVKQIDKQKFESEIELRKIQKNIFYKWGR